MADRPSTKQAEDLAPAGFEHPEEDEYPEHAKAALHHEQMQAVGNFLDESEYVLAEWQQVHGFDEPQLVPAQKPLQRIIEEHYIDPDKLEAERRAMLKDLQDQQED